jgi:aspartyl-tRNA synthetase
VQLTRIGGIFMGQSMTGLKRTHYCGAVRAADIGKEITVMGWVNKQRYLSNVIFIVVRDRTGLVQVAVEERANPEMYEYARGVRGEYVVAVRGVVKARTEGNVNPEMETGEIEIEATELRVLSESEVPPFTVQDEGVATDMRLKYRYIDLRRPEMQRIFRLRHDVANCIRTHLDGEGFTEVETPMLVNSSPEGARDYLVASRVHPGHFYALPQSPQQMKQVLMMSGFDRYYQIARCFRDEDLRADRQPEFTQVDIEMSFAEETDVQEMAENLAKSIMQNCMDTKIDTPFPRLTWHEAMRRYGCDKPDTRFGMELQDITAIVNGSEFGVFQNAIDGGGTVQGICATGCAAMPRKQIDAMVEVAKTHGAKGLAWIVLGEEATKTTISKFFDDAKIAEITAQFGAQKGDLIFLCADATPTVWAALAAVRLACAKWAQLPLSGWNFLWVEKFPLFEYSEEDNRYYAAHHPFTAPLEEDENLMETDPSACRARAYDLVLNGHEIAGGSIRIHRADVQARMFAALGFTPESAKEGFGYFLDALKYGVPPHGGIAFGFDRLIMLLAGADSIREVIAFPKVKDASCPLTAAPNKPTAEQLAELSLAVTANE